MADAEAMLTSARRPLVVGIGGGGDVVGALATAEACRIYHGAEFVVGGVTWERRPIDPRPGPRRLEEAQGVEQIAPGVALAGPDAGVPDAGVTFAEGHMARFLGERTLLVDPNGGPAAVADALGAAADALGCDLVVLLDVGGDALAHGGEPGLGSPLCDALLLAAGARAQALGLPVLGAIFGAGCDGELTPGEVLERVSEVAAAGGLAGVRGLTEPVAARLEQAVRAVPTEASAQALRCFHGERGDATIRGGARRVELSSLGATTFYFDLERALGSAARLARAPSTTRRASSTRTTCCTSSGSGPSSTSSGSSPRRAASRAPAPTRALPIDRRQAAGTVQVSPERSSSASCSASARRCASASSRPSSSA